MDHNDAMINPGHGHGIALSLKAYLNGISVFMQVVRLGA
jgi:hypothetical protein